MNAQPTTHPADEQLSAFGLGKLNEAAAAAIAHHLEGCLSCRKAVEHVAGDTFVGLVRAAKAPASPSSPTPMPQDRNLSAPQPPAAPPPGLPPELANHAKYRILRELGRGGMGVVYQAEHIQMERLVAIKVMNKSILGFPNALERFAQEVRAAAKLGHPNIVAAYDFEQAGDLHMLVMEFVEGQDLAQVLARKGPLPILNACHYVRQAALGLQHAHEKGMVHRDLKPQNMMLTPKGTVKLLDMGLARVANDKAGLTGTGAMLGTPEFIAPEQAMDTAKADIRSDIYSLGCTLYCLLAGRPPFAEGSPMTKILGHLEKEPPPLAQFRPEVPPNLAAVVARMMVKDPAKRYQKPIEVAQALAPFCKPGDKGAVAAPAAETMAASSSPVRADTLTDDDAAGKAVPAKKKIQKVRSQPSGSAAKKWLIGGAATGVALLILLVLLGLAGLWAAGVFKVKTKDGTIVLENLPPDADVTVDGGTVTVKSSDGKTFEVRVDPGKKHRLEVKKEGFKVFGDEVEVDAGGRKAVVVRLEPSQPTADDNKKPNPNPPQPSPPSGKDSLTDYAALAKGRWVALLPSVQEFNRLLNDKAYQGPQPKFAASILECNDGRMSFLPLKAKDAIIRAQVKLFRTNPQKGNLHLALRYRSGHTVSAWCNGDGWFGIGRTDSGGYKDLKSCQLPDRYDDYFFEFAFAAVGDNLIVYVNGQKILEARDEVQAEYSGDIAVGTSQRRGLFRDLEVQILDKTTAKPDNQGFVSLFNGKDLTGWKTHPKQPSGWTVEDGCLVGRSATANHLFSERGDYENFHLRAEVQINKYGNSGIFFRSNFGLDRGDTFPNAYEAQILHSYPKPNVSLTGGLQGFSNVVKPMFKPDEWFTMDVIAEGNHFVIKINGEVTTDFEDNENTYRKGHIALQAMSDTVTNVTTVVRFRKIEIKEPPLTPADPFQANSVWVNTEKNMTLTVLERKGDRFLARFVIGGGLDREINGTIKDGKVTWSASDVRVIKGKAGGDNEGTITSDKDGDLINFVYGDGKNVLGTFTLRLKTSK